MSVKFCFYLLSWLHLKGNNARDKTRINDNGFIMTNIYMSQLIVTEKQKGKHAFIGIKLYKIQLCMPYVLRLEIKSSNCSFINIPSPHFSRFCFSLKFH